MGFVKRAQSSTKWSSLVHGTKLSIEVDHRIETCRHMDFNTISAKTRMKFGANLPEKLFLLNRLTSESLVED